MLGQAGGDLALLARTGGSLALVLILMLATAWLLNRHQARRGHAARAGRLAVLASQIMDPRTKLVLIRCDAREYLLAVGPAGVSVIAATGMEVPASSQEVPS